MEAPPPHPLSDLTDKTDRWFQRASAALLGQVPCSPGCHICCIGPFPITLLDRQSIQQGLKLLSPTQRAEIVFRAQEQVAAMQRAFPPLAQSPSLDQWADVDIDRLVETFHQLPCPALGADGLCQVYSHRPLACRSMGIPTEEAGMVQGACDVQTSVPLIRLSAALRNQEHELARAEAMALALLLPQVQAEGEEVLLPFGFVPASPTS